MVGLQTPLKEDQIQRLHAGEQILLSGSVYTARDAAHKKMAALIQLGKEPPFPFAGNAVYYAGPCPAPPGRIIGSIGPTTSGRMDGFAPLMMEHGLKIMIGKGQRSQTVKDAIARYGGVYFAAIGGAAALMARCVKSSEVIAFEELGAEAIRRIYVDALPLVVAVDQWGGDVYDFMTPNK